MKLKACFTAALIAVATTLPANASDLTSLMKRTAIAAERVITAAERPHPRLADVANKAATLSAIMISLQSVVERNPSEAAEHLDAIKGMAQDMINLGMMLMSAAGAENGDENADVTIEQFEKIAMSIRDNAQVYE